MDDDGLYFGPCMSGQPEIQPAPVGHVAGWQSMFPMRPGISATVPLGRLPARTLALLFGEPVWRMRLRLARARVRRLLGIRGRHADHQES